MSWRHEASLVTYKIKIQLILTLILTLIQLILILGMINMTIRYKERKIMVTLYKSLVRPHLEYCVSAWSPHYLKNKELIERVQHRFTRMFKDFKWRNYDERLKSLNLWTLEERRNRQDSIEVFKMYEGFTRLSIDELFERDVNIKGTRGHTLRLKKKQNVRDVRRYFFHRQWWIDAIVWTRKQ